MGNVKDISGQQINGWYVLREYGRNKSGGATFLCRCDCGNVRVVDGRSIRNGASKNCGCKRNTDSVERMRSIATKHGGKKERLYGVWRGMIDRCNNPKSPFYYRYGGRGISVCDKWQYSYKSFREWAYASGYNEKAQKWECTIDRVNNNAGYSPDNCIWRTLKQQCNNRSSNHFVEYNGESHTLTEWSELTGIKKDTLRRRIFVYNWTVERALTEPTHNYNHKGI